MHGRCLSQSKGNLKDIDVFLENNIHEYDAWVYGIQQNKNLSADIIMTLRSNIVMKLLFYLRFESQQSLQVSNLQLSLDKQARINNEMSLTSRFSFSLDKQTRIESINTLITRIEILLDKYVKAFDIKMAISIGTLDIGKMISDIEDMTIEEIEDLTIEEITKKFDSIYGLKIGLIKNTYISDVEDLYISDVEDLTIEEFCYTKIY